MADEIYDVIIIGAGIAGASAAYELSAHRRVLVLEGEPHAGYHATGRSAAVFSEIYGCAEFRALSRASRRFYESPPPGFDRPLLRPRGALFVANADQGSALADLAADKDVANSTHILERDDIRRLVPIISTEWSRAALHEPGCRDIDVNSLHQGFLRGLKERGGEVRFSARIGCIRRKASLWRLGTPDWTVHAPILVNAAGAWADEVAIAAGVAPIGLAPCRRTAITIEAPRNHEIRDWPLVIAADESFYFKPDAGRLLVSPADETLCHPCDAQPEELDIATAAHRFEQATDLTVRRILSSWAGLRTFAPDRRPVIGFDPHNDGFFWLSGQGGYGVQTAAAAARLVVNLIERERISDDLADQGITQEAISPGRCQRDATSQTEPSSEKIS